MIALAETPPEGLLPWVRADREIKWDNYLIYRAGRYRDPLTGMSEKCVDAVCTVCGQSMKLEHVANGNGEAPFGFAWNTPEGKRLTGRSGRKVCCPECGAEVTARHISYVKHTDEFVWPISLEPMGETLILYLWRVQRWADKQGEIHWDARPWEAVAYSQGKAYKYVHWMKTINGATCYLSKWESRVRFTDTIYDIDLVYCPEGIGKATLGTCMENSKLELYMAVKGEYRFPATWLRIYQRHNNAENLMTCAAAKLTAGMLASEKRVQTYTRCFNENTDLLKTVDWKKVRPWDMLRIQKEELGYFNGKAREDGAERLAVTMLLRKSGFSVHPGEENPEWMRGSAREFMRLGIHPAKVESYLSRQKRKYPKDCITEYGITDYWRDAEWLGMDLNDPVIRWPQRFKTAHDAAADRRRTLMDEERKRIAAAEAAERDENFRKRFERMSRYAWEKDGILIRPARTVQELIDEGKELSHCVASYAPRHAAGGLTIFFVRHASEPDKPWFTLNFNEKTMSVTENRGKCNCARTPEVQAFENAWLAWVRAGAKKKKTNKEANAA